MTTICCLGGDLTFGGLLQESGAVGQELGGAWFENENALPTELSPAGQGQNLAVTVLHVPRQRSLYRHDVGCLPAHLKTTAALEGI